MEEFDLPGTLRRIRRTADLSQRELARAAGVSPSVVSKAETGDRDVTVGLLGRLAAVAGLRLAVLDAESVEVVPMDPGAVRDAGGRLFPAHLDTRHGDEDWWGGPHRPRLRQPRYTYDQRGRRDARRARLPTPEDHLLPRPGDALADRAAARRRALHRAAAEERQRLFLEGAFRDLPDPFTCTCPAECDFDEERNPDLLHDPACACRCDVS